MSDADAVATLIRLARASQKAREWTTTRDALIHLARAEGSSLREVGRAAGLSHEAVAKIGRKAS